MAALAFLFGKAVDSHSLITVVPVACLTQTARLPPPPALSMLGTLGNPWKIFVSNGNNITTLKYLHSYRYFALVAMAPGSPDHALFDSFNSYVRDLFLVRVCVCVCVCVC